MGIFGNLENLNLGMGLKAVESQYIAKEHASLEGWSSLSEQDGQKASLSVFATLLLLFIIYKLGSN